MTEIEISIHPKERMAYIPKHIYGILGKRVRAVGDAVAVLLYPEGANLDRVMESLKVIEQHLTLVRKLRQAPHPIESLQQDRRLIEHG